MVKLLHIGLPKCGSTYLQNDIFPKIASKVNSKYINLYKNNLFNANKSFYKHALENFKNLENLLPDNFIISNEHLFSQGWEFSRIEKSFKYLKKNFSSDTIILIIIRNPYDLLNSIYIQSIHEMRIVKPEKFFYIDKNEENIRVNNKFNLYNFDYKKLISLYKNYFKKVVIVKYENLNNLDFLKDIYELDNNYVEELRKSSKKLYNKSISKFGVNFLLFINNFFNVQKNQEFILKTIKPSNNIILKIKNKILSFFLLRYLFQNKLDRIFYKKYLIKNEFIPIDLQKEALLYDQIDI